MRVQGLNGAATAAAKSGTRAAVRGSFQIGADDAAKGPATAGALRSVTSLDALIALQSVEDATERRKRAVKNGRHALDALDALKLSVLGGSLDQSVLGRLKSAAEGLKGSSGDAGLDSVLGEIELRLEVELAKAGRA